MPLISVAIQVTIVAPTAYGPTGLCVIVIEPEGAQLSTAVAVPIDALDVHIPASVLRVAAEGHVIIGDVPSLTVITCA